MSRTTLDIDSTVLEQLRDRAADEHKSMGQLASEVLATGLKRQPMLELPPVRWPIKDLGRPRIDLEDKDALWGFLDRESFEQGDGS